VGVWGWGLGSWAHNPNPQSPIPNPQSPIPKIYIYIFQKINILSIFRKYILKKINENYQRKT
jgi:hypothetical protein